MTMVGRWFAEVISWPKRFVNWVISPEFDQDVEDIRLATVRLCGFMPTVATVVNILALGRPTMLAATGVATAICVALTRKKQEQASGVATLVDTPPMIEGVVIEGEWVK
jgi:hypothetical protein